MSVNDQVQGLHQDVADLRKRVRRLEALLKLMSRALDADDEELHQDVADLRKRVRRLEALLKLMSRALDADDEELEEEI